MFNFNCNKLKLHFIVDFDHVLLMQQINDFLIFHTTDSNF